MGQIHKTPVISLCDGSEDYSAGEARRIAVSNIT
jgi:hypothetical protein